MQQFLSERLQKLRSVANIMHEMKARQKFTDSHLNKAFKTFYSGFLTETEMQRVIEGTDLWMDTDETIERWQNRLNYLKGITNEQEK